MRQLVENAVEAMKPIKPREAATGNERARLFWRWAFEEIKKGKMAKQALKNIPLKIGKEEIIDIDNSSSDDSDDDQTISVTSGKSNGNMSQLTFNAPEKLN